MRYGVDTEGEGTDYDYVDGRNAERQGKDLKDNPNRFGTQMNKAWERGWTDRRKERNSLEEAEKDLLREIDRVRLAINAARAAGFPLEGVEDKHDRVLELRKA